MSDWCPLGSVQWRPGGFPETPGSLPHALLEEPPGGAVPGPVGRLSAHRSGARVVAAAEGSGSFSLGGFEVSAPEHTVDRWELLRARRNGVRACA